ncbi:MAG: hypothetical protein WC551_07910 [Patescibacteria group bacterium]
MSDGSITIDLQTSLTKNYNMRYNGPYILETTLPKDVLEREARVQGVSLSDFVRSFELIWYYGSFPGMYVEFRRKGKVAG